MRVSQKLFAFVKTHAAMDFLVCVLGNAFAFARSSAGIRFSVCVRRIQRAFRGLHTTFQKRTQEFSNADYFSETQTTATKRTLIFQDQHYFFGTRLISSLEGFDPPFEVLTGIRSMTSMRSGWSRKSRRKSSPIRCRTTVGTPLCILRR